MLKPNISLLPCQSTNQKEMNITEMTELDLLIMPRLQAGVATTQIQTQKTFRGGAFSASFINVNHSPMGVSS